MMATGSEFSDSACGAGFGSGAIFEIVVGSAGLGVPQQEAAGFSSADEQLSPVKPIGAEPQQPPPPGTTSSEAVWDVDGR